MIFRLVFFTFVIVSLINSYLDLKTMEVSLIVNYIGILISVVLYFISSPQLLIRNLLGSFILFLVFVLVWKITRKGLGWGDIHYSIYCGLISGFPGFIFSGIITSLIGLLLFLIMKLISNKKNVKNIKVPFIPIMFAGTMCGMALPDSFIMKILNI